MSKKSSKFGARAFDGTRNTAPAMFVNLLTLWGLEAPLSYGLAQGTGIGITGVWVGRVLAKLPIIEFIYHEADALRRR